MISSKRTRLKGLAVSITALEVSVVAFAMTLLAFASVANARPWSEHSGHLAMLSKQMETHENEIKALIDHKRHTTDAKHIAELIKQIDENHKALVKVGKEYEEERQHVRFQHPEKNDQLDRTYVRHDVKSVEDIENELGLDARLDRVKARALMMFPLPEKEQKVAMPKAIYSRRPASQDNDEDAPEKIHLIK
jgi:hypothetical protein